MSWETQLIRAAVGIIKIKDKILLAERPVGKPYSGYWEFPGGKIEENESGSAALKRELHEELGIEVIDAEFWFQHQYQYPDKTVHLEIFLVNKFSGEAKSKENQQLCWVSVAEMSELPLLEGNWLIIE